MSSEEALSSQRRLLGGGGMWTELEKIRMRRRLEDVPDGQRGHGKGTKAGKSVKGKLHGRMLSVTRAHGPR